MQREAGGHRWQRVPPTERNSRVHTSSLTVAVLQPEPIAIPALHDRDIDVRVTKDTGPGGQHRNKTESCIVLTHRPTGITVKSALKCQHQNRRQARIELERRVAEVAHHALQAQRNATRRQQTGSGERGDKIRTYRVQDDLVTDHRSGRKARLHTVLAGDLKQLA